MVEMLENPFKLIAAVVVMFVRQNQPLFIVATFFDLKNASRI